MTAVNIGKILAGDIAVGEEVTVRGWLRTRRDSKAGLSFLALNDGSSLDSLQIVTSSELDNYQNEILSLTTGCSLACTGTLTASQGKGQSVEVEARSVEVVGWVEDPDTYPVPAKRHSFEYLREVAHLRARTNTFAAITRVRHGLARAIHDYLHREGYYWINTPIITANDCEGAGELFRVSTLDLANLPRTEAGTIDFGQDFFGRESYLTVSGQLNAEALCLAMGRVYTFGPTFRAENSNTSRHLAEFWMVEPEIAFEDLTGAARLAEAMLKDVFAAVLEGYPQEMAFFQKFVDRECIGRLEHVIETPFAHMDYDEAVRILQASGKQFEFPVEWGRDLQSEHERYLSEEHVRGPLVVTNYPSALKPFYMRVNDDGRTVAALDVLVPGIGEIVGGSQREERLDVLDSRLQAAGIDAADYGWYRDLRRYGTVPHSGFGLGFERTLGYVCGMSNVRDLIPFPRTPQHARF